jgi:cytochrome-b5 reductase
MQISLIYANVTEEDILLRSELNFKARIGGDKFRVFYTLDKPPEGGARAA